MQQVRKGEEAKLRFRSSRLFVTQNKWYFSTREGTTIGPFTTRRDANYGLALFTEYLSQPDAHFDFAQKVATEGLWAVSFLHFSDASRSITQFTSQRHSALCDQPKPFPSLAQRHKPLSARQ